MLGFRSLFRTHDTPDLLDITTLGLAEWLRRKRYDPTRIVGAEPVEIAEDVWGSVQHHTDEAGSRTMRARIVENSGASSWTSELTVHNSPTGNRGWVWLDIHKPDDHRWTATPRLARQLVRALPARDGAHLLNAHPRLVEGPGVRRVIDALTDPERRGLAFVAGTAHLTDTAQWRDAVESLLDDTEGLANAWVLTPRATVMFNDLVRSHGVQVGAVRTYLPGVEVGNPFDAQRHRYLAGRTIGPRPSRAMQRLLGQRAREQMIAARLPVVLRDLDRILRREIDSELLEQLTPVGPEPVRRPSSPAPVPPAPAPRQPEIVEEPAAVPVVEPVPTLVTPAEAAPLVLAERVTAMLLDLLGTDEVTHDNLARIESLARTAQRADLARQRISDRLAQLQTSVDEAGFERDLAREALADEQRERADAEEERAEAERRLRHVRTELSRLGRADVAWTDTDIEVRDIRPDTFVDLLDRLNELEHVVFTGDDDTTLDLDKHGYRSWSGKVWDALLALDDYARISITTGFPGDVSAYLADTPPSCRTFSGRRHASTESEDVHRNPRLRTPRELPVPDEIDPSGSAFMGAHFKIAQSATISPRVHYLDATARTKVVYVGYIGPHLPLSTS